MDYPNQKNTMGSMKPQPQPRAKHRPKDQGSTASCQYSSSDEEFHSDDNLRPYEEVKIAHHNKKLAGLGLTPDESVISPLENMDHSTRLYSYLSGSDGDIETDNALSSAQRPNHHPHHRHHHHHHHHHNHHPHGPHGKWERRGSRSSVSSEELDNRPRDSRISHLTLSDSDGEQDPHQALNALAGTLQIPPPSYPPPPPPPIEDIPQRVPPPTTPRQKNFGPSMRGNYSNSEGFPHLVGGEYSVSEIPVNGSVLRQHYSEGESDFESHYLVQTPSGNVYIPPTDAQGMRFPRTVPRAGTVPSARSPADNSSAHMPLVSESCPRQLYNAGMNGGEPAMHYHQNGIDRQAFMLPQQQHHPPPQFGATQTAPLSGYPGGVNDYTYYSKFSSAGNRMTKQLKQRCSWKCTALVLLLLCIGLLAVVAYFAERMFNEEDKVKTNTFCLDQSDSGGKLSAVLPGSLPSDASSPLFFHPGERQQHAIPPKAFWNTQFSQKKPSFLKFNFTLSHNAILGFYGRKSIPPSHIQHEFSETLDGKRLEPRSKRRAKRQTHESATALRFYLEPGTWYFSVYNDGDQTETISFISSLHDSIGTNCPSDCHGHGECKDGQCECYPGYTGWDCLKPSCPILCNKNGKYVRGQCQCYLGWKGRECELLENECEVSNCNGKGQCMGGHCVCMQGFQGPDCSEMDCLLPNCSGQGVCVLGQCMCFKGYKGSDCSVSDTINIEHVCAKDCSSHGMYNIDAGKCLCDRHFTGRDCQTEICRLECHHGYCKDQSCVCYEGWTGLLCEQVSCDRRCHANGFCTNGTCACKTGWNGKHCTLDGCPSGCAGNGKCQMYAEGWSCNCRAGWKGKGCDIAMETECSDMKDNDNDGLKDCLDPDCCVSMACSDSIHCHTSPNPLDILLRKQSPSTTASFYEKMRFLIEESSVQNYATRNAFNESQVSVIRGRVISLDGSPLVGVRVGVVTQPLYGFTLTREKGLFDILVNGGGSVTLQFMRQPFRTKSASVLVPWNQIITMDVVIMTLESETSPPNAALCSVEHEHYWLRPVVLSTWQHTQLGACPDKSTIIPESQVLQESLSIPGTDVHLIYQGSETSGFMSVILIQMTPESIPDRLSLVHLRVSVEGVIMEKVFEADPGLKYTFSWDRLNTYKMKVYGIVTARVYVGYQYIGCDYIFWETRSTTMSGYDLTSSEIGGWNLGIHHTYNFQEGILHKGDGTNIYLKEKPKKLINVLGNGHRRKLDCDGCNGKANENRLIAPVALASGLDGSLYLGDYNFVRKLSPSREEVASILEMSSASVPYKYYMTVSPVDGRLYISDYMNHKIIRIKTMGPVRSLDDNFEVVAGNGEQCTPGEADRCGDGGRALEARLMHPKGIAINKDGIIYVADGPNIRLITMDGKIHTLIGSQEQMRKWTPMPCDDIISAEEVSLRWPTALAISPLDDTLHILDNNIVLKLTRDRKLITVAGRPIYCPPKQTSFLPTGILSDDEQASSIADHVILVSPESLTFGPHGDLFIVESDTHHINRIRVVTTDGRIHHYAGAKSKCDCQKLHCKCYDMKKMLAAQALFDTPTSVSVTPDGVLHIADMGNLRVHSIVSELPVANYNRQYEVFSPETQELYIFNRYGQHQHTINVMTNQYMYNYTYNVNSFYGKLVQVTDSNSNQLKLIRDYDTNVKEIQPPNGMKCHLMMDNRKRLHKFVSPENLTSIFTYTTSSGLLETKQLSDGKLYFYEYDEAGRLQRVTQPTGEVVRMERDVNATGSIVHISTDSNDAVAMATYGSVQSVMHDTAKTKVTYLPDGAVVVVFPSNLTVAMETGSHPILEAEHRMHFKRKLVLPNMLVHRLEWRYYLRREGRNHRKGRIIDKLGRRIRINGENLLTVEYHRDHHMEVILDKENKELLTVMYNKASLPTNFLPSRGHQPMNISYNRFGDITQWQYGDLHEEKRYNERGLLVERNVPNNAQYRYLYRTGHKPTDVILPSGKQYLFQYDNLGNLIEVTTPGLGKHMFSSVDTIGFQRYIYHPAGVKLPYIEDYDASGKLRQIVYPSEQRRVVYRYNNIYQPVTVLFDEAEVMLVYRKDIRKLSSAEVMQRSYGCQQQYLYTGALVRQAQLKFLLDYQLLGSIFRYDYDNYFHLTAIQATFSNNLTTDTNFTYSRYTGNLASIKTFKIHKPLPDREMVADKNIKILKDYDNYGRLRDLQFKFNDAVKFNLHVTYDTASRVKHWKQQIGQTNGKAYDYTYDVDGNVIEVKVDGKSIWVYGYDANSNLAKVTERRRVTKLHYNTADRAHKFGELRYKYDGDGFLMQRGDEYLNTNSFSQLISIVHPNKFKIMFYYDADSRLVAYKEGKSRILQYFYGDPMNKHRVTHAYNHTNSILTQFHYDNAGHLFALERSKNSWYYVATDPNGSPVAVFNSRGYLTKKMNYDPLGMLTYDSNPAFDVPFGFQGAVYNPIARVLHINSRAYDPLTGRWMSPDYGATLRALHGLLDHPQTLNLYQYRELVKSGNNKQIFPITDMADWLSMLGFNFRSLAPDVSYMGEVGNDNSYHLTHQLMPRSSAFECTFRRDMDNILKLTNMPSSKVTPKQKSPQLRARPYTSLLGNGMTVSIRDGRVVVNLLEGMDDLTRKLATVLLNNSQAVDLHYTVKGKDVHYFVKSEISQAEIDLSLLSFRSDKISLDNGINVTIHRLLHTDGLHGHSQNELDIRLHGNHSIINLRYGTTIEKEHKRLLAHAKQRAVNHAWTRERMLIDKSLPSEYTWSESEKNEIVTAGYADGYDADYIRDVIVSYPELSDDCNNIRFYKST